MDPISLIVAALVAGLTSGLRSATQEAVVDSYRALRDRLAGTYGPGVRASIHNLEKNPNSTAEQSALAAQLRQAGAGTERELANLAANLMALIENPVEYGESARTDPTERLRRTSGLNAIAEVIAHHVDAVLRVRAQFDVQDEELLSTRISRQRQLPDQLRDNLASLHRRMRTIILQVATSIEEARYREVDLALANMHTGLGVQQRAANLVRADKNMHISYETLRLTVEFFSKLNQQAIGRIEGSTSVQQESNMMFGNAILILELTDFVIGFIDGFQLTDGLDALHDEALEQINVVRKQQAEFKARLSEATDVEEAVRRFTLDDIGNRDAALGEVEKEWDRYLLEVRQLRTTVGDVRAKLPTLFVIRENARLQIQTLQLVAMLRFLKQNSESVKGAVASLQGFQLAPLSPNRVRRLLGIADPIG